VSVIHDIAVVTVAVLLVRAILQAVCELLQRAAADTLELLMYDVTLNPAEATTPGASGRVVLCWLIAALALPMLLVGCEAPPMYGADGSTEQGSHPSAELSFNDYYHPRRGFRNIMDVPVARRSLLLRIVGFYVPVKHKFSDEGRAVGGGCGPR
jgi:hypothetical protein